MKSKKVISFRNKALINAACLAVFIAVDGGGSFARADSTLNTQTTVAGYATAELSDPTGGTLTVTAPAFNGYGGAVAVVFDGILNGTGNINFIDNSAVRGGAIFAWGLVSQLNFNGKNVSFLNNRATDSDGGAICAQGVVSFSNALGTVELSRNQAAESGGAIYALHNTTFAGNAVLNNNTAASGGAIYADAVVISNNATFGGNTAGTDGGAVYATSEFTVFGSANLSNNSAVRNGGAIFSAKELNLFDGVVLKNNTAHDGGGASVGGTVVLIGDITMDNNRATNGTGGRGGAILTGGSLYLTGTNIAITNNIAATTGGAFSLINDVFSLTVNAGGTFSASGNKAANDASGGFLYIGGAETKTMTFNIGAGATGSVGNAASGANNADSIAGAGVLVKNGSGTLNLWGTNSYTGATTVSAGALSINGNSTALTGLTTVNNTAVLQGIGRLGGDVQVNPGAVFRPGFDGGSVTTGTFYAGGNVTLAAGSTLVFTIKGTGDSSSLVFSGGTLSTNGATLDLIMDSNSVINIGDVFNLITGGAISTSNLIYAGKSLSNGDTVTVGGAQFQVGTGATGLSLTALTALTQVPEPSTYEIFAAIGLAGAVGFRRLKRRSLSVR